MEGLWNVFRQHLKFSDLTNLSLSNDVIISYPIPVSSSAHNLGFIYLWLWHVFLWSNQLSTGPNLVISTSETSVEFVIFFLFLQPQHLQIHLSLANLTTAIHFTPDGISQTNLNKLQHIQNSLARAITNTSKYQHITPTLEKLYWLPIKESSTNSVFSHTKHLQINNLHIFTMVFHFRHTLFLQDLLIHLFFPFHMSDHYLAKGLSLSLVYDWNSLPPDTQNLNSLPIFRSRLKTHAFKNAFPP